MHGHDVLEVRSASLQQSNEFSTNDPEDFLQGLLSAITSNSMMSVLYGCWIRSALANLNLFGDSKLEHLGSGLLTKLLLFLSELRGTSATNFPLLLSKGPLRRFSFNSALFRSRLTNLSLWFSGLSPTSQ